MSIGKKERLIKRLAWYWPFEAGHAFVTFPAFFVYLIYSKPLQNIIFALYGIIVCIFILYQGQRYWRLKLMRLKNQHFDNDKNIQFFRSSKKINKILIGLMPLFLILQWMLKQEGSEAYTYLIIGLAINAFAILEHINYYHTQLMIDNQYDLSYVIRNKRLKKASLAKDLIDGKI